MPEQEARILADLGIDPTTYVAHPRDDVRAADHLFVLRHTLMNPWLLSRRDGGSYIDQYLEYLESRLLGIASA